MTLDPRDEAGESKSMNGLDPPNEGGCFSLKMD